MLSFNNQPLVFVHRLKNPRSDQVTTVLPSRGILPRKTHERYHVHIMVCSEKAENDLTVMTLSFTLLN